MGSVRHSAISFLTRSAALAAISAALPLYAQVEGTGTLQGTITDPSGAVVAGATITVTEPATGRAVSQTTPGSGSYVISALPPGQYTIDVHAKGFRPVLQENVTVNALTVVSVDLKLQVGSGSENVVVTSAPPDLDTENGSLDTTIPNSTYTALPLAMNGGPKSPLGFLSLVPGVASGDFGVENINGGPSNSSFLYVNGLPVTTSEMQGDARNINGSTSTEVVDQFQVISSGVPAFYAGQGVTNLVTKSGTNQLHGDVYENLRNTALDAAGYFSTTTPVEHQNEYGGAAGGPIRRNRLFFFGNFDRFKITNGNPPTFYSLPTEAERMGDFSALPVPIYDPATTTCVAGVCTRQPFAHNKIPMGRISSVSNQLQSYLPATQNGNLQNNFANAFTAGSTQNTYLGKLDATITTNHHAYALFQYGKVAPIGIPTNGGPQLPLPYASTRTALQIIWLAQLGETWAITPNLVNVVGVQLNRFETPFTNPTLSPGGYPAKAGLTGLPSGNPSSEFPSISFGGPESPTFWANNGYSQSFSETANTFVYQDNLQWIHGRHSLTFGGQAILQQENNVEPNVLGGINFSNTESAGFDATGGIVTTTGNAYASYLLGDVDNASATDTSVQETGARYKNYAIYAQDDYKITPKLTVNLGLRYIIPKPFIEVQDRNSWFNPTLPNAAVSNFPGALQFAGHGVDSCQCSTQVQTHYLTFDPRVGAAYAFNAKTVLRGSYSINHFNGGALGGNAESQGTSLLGYAANPSFQSADSGITPAFNWNTGFPAYQHPPFFDATLNTGYNTTTGATAGGVSYNRPDTAARSPYTENWNLTLEQAFAPTITWSLSYAGSQSHFIGVNGGVGIYSNEIQPQDLALGNLLQQPLTAATLAQAQAIIPGIKIPYANFEGSIGQALRPFPQYSSVGDPWADFGSANYNALQTSLQKRISRGLYFLLSYTWSKNQDNAAGIIDFIYATPRSAYDLHAERAVSNEDYPHQVSLAYVYELPIGKGHAIGGDSRWQDLLIGGWQTSGLNHYTSGTPLGTINASCNVPFTGGCYANYGVTDQARINGSYGKGSPRTTPYLNVNAFSNPAPFTFGNTPRTLAYGLRNPWSLDEDVSVGKNFHAGDRFTLRLQGDAFNVLNRTVFGGIGTNITSSNFGYISSQANSPRQLQLEAYVKF